MADNTLYYGDNLDILRRYVDNESVDLVYLDPPFKSDATYNVLFGEQDGSQAAAQIKAFEDTWRWDQAAAAAYQETVEMGGQVSRAMQAFRQLLGENTMLAYLAMMAPRLVELRRVMKETASIYLHCDPTASHYLKLLMDAVFGPKHYRNEIIWERTTGRKGVSQYGRVHDVLLFYTKSMKATWHPPTTPQNQNTVKGHDIVRDKDGRLWRISDLTGMGTGPARIFGDLTIAPPAGRHWMYDQEGIDQLMADGRITFSRGGRPRLRTPLDDLSDIAVRDIWTDVEPINSGAAERLGYPTQKPLALLERIINASSNEGDLVLDPFCGCGTAVAAAQKLTRRWIGIDITHLAVTLMKHRLHNSFGDQAQYQVIGEPVSVPGAQALADSDPYQFQWWALGLVDARPADGKKGADKGIDGRLYFHDEGVTGKTKQVIFSVKAGKNVNVSQVRDLRGVLDREKAEIGVLISMEKPTKPMRTEAASAGFYDSPWGTRHPRLQILTIEDLLDKKKIDMPPTRSNITFKKAQRVKKNEATIAMDMEDQ